MAISKRLDYDPKQNACEDAYVKMLENRRKAAEEEAKLIEESKKLEESKGKYQKIEYALMDALMALDEMAKANIPVQAEVIATALTMNYGEEVAIELVKELTKRI